MTECQLCSGSERYSQNDTDTVKLPIVSVETTLIHLQTCVSELFWTFTFTHPEQFSQQIDQLFVV
jgi:hypothetical protein